ncbi:Protein translocase subunit SecDF [Paenibacillus plantiphilus]|uniref:Protein-export membrane protein SecF n=1 Tax=Paenibacillus plantiphilus TaxID=2905650 RepID=A0ABN8GCL5_9BACL|nr:protein translocase subunit SecF [Paenibacillus plantiphilus]CAH1204311.1 Protein translocase subunit SecDF [Paenibacillus plantiphilus]
MNFNKGDNSTRFNFVAKSRHFFIFSIVITILGVLSLAIFGLNYGVDFKSGSSVDIVVTKDLSGKKAEIEKFIADSGLGAPATTIGADRITLRFDNVLSDVEEHKLKDGFAASFDKDASMEVYIVDVEIARELQFNALKAILIASLGIIIYVSIRFEWRFAIAAIVALLHDAFIVISLFSILRLEVNLPFIVAILTIIGYSINDTIVIFDRIRENMRFAKVKTAADLAKVVNDSVWQTLSRSINTVLTVVVTALCLFLFGGESIKLFALAILFGLASGAYSSIFIASPLWLLLKRGQKPKQGSKVSTTS